MKNEIITEEVNGWRVLVENTKDIIDPSEVEYSFILFKDGKIKEKESSMNGFCHDAKEQIRKKLQYQIDALDKPFVREKSKKWIVEEIE